MEELNTVDAVAEGVVDLQADSQNIQQAENSETSTSTETSSEKTSEVAEPKQTKEENKAFAEMRREIEKLRKDAEIAKNYGDQGIYNSEDYDKAVLRSQAEEAGINPEVYEKFITMEKELNDFRLEKELLTQAETLQKDPIKGEFYSKWKDDIHQNSKQFNVDLETSFLLTLGNKLGELKTPNTEELKKQAIKEYIEEVRGNSKPVETGGTAPTTVTSSPKSFEEARKSAMAFMRGQKNL
jgi:hypothetical protein